MYRYPETSIKGNVEDTWSKNHKTHSESKKKVEKR